MHSSSNSYLFPGSFKNSSNIELGKYLRPVWVSLREMPLNKKSKYFVILFPNLLLSGVVSSNDLTPNIISFFLFFCESIMLDEFLLISV
jgi:hypothetical protein